MKVEQEIKIYKGKRLGPKELCGDILVTVNGKPLKHIIRHSPTGFEFGYGGSGPADLALSILWDLLGEEPLRPLYMDFKSEFVASWKDEWEISSAEIRRWIQFRIGKVAKKFNFPTEDKIEELSNSKFLIMNLEIKTKIENLIKDLKEEKEYYKWDIRYNFYEMIIRKLEAIINETFKIKEGG